VRGGFIERRIGVAQILTAKPAFRERPLFAADITRGGAAPAAAEVGAGATAARG